MDISDGRRRRRQHSAEFKAKVVAACRQPGVSIAAVALANSLNANLLRRWVGVEEQPQRAERKEPLSAPAARLDIDKGSFIPVRVEAPPLRDGQPISIELRRGATVVKVTWPLPAASDCAAWLRELLR